MFPTLYENDTPHVASVSNQQTPSTPVSSLAGVGRYTPAPSGASQFPVQTAIRTLHGVAIVRSRWADGAWQHRFPSHSQPGKHHITTSAACDCMGYTHHGRCYHVACVQDIEAQLHSDIYEALRFMRWCNSSEEIDFGWRELARLNIGKETALAVMAADRTVA